MLRIMEVVANEWGGQKSSVGRAVTHIPELRAEDNGRLYRVFCLRGGNVAFFADERRCKEGTTRAWTR